METQVSQQQGPAKESFLNFLRGMETLAPDLEGKGSLQLPKLP